MSSVSDIIRQNYEALQAKIAAACERVGRDPESVTLIAVVKYAEWEWVQTLVALGVADLGESRPQQLVERRPQLDDDIRWHLIGRLQRNKIRKVLPATSLIHSIDSLKLLRAVDRVAEELNLTPRVLLQVNISGEATKAGFSPDGWRSSWQEVKACRHVEVAGLMTMAPESSDPNDARSTFSGLAKLREELGLTELSMGMSGDFEVAIEEEATMVRHKSIA